MRPSHLQSRVGIAIGAIALLVPATASAATYTYDGANRLVSVVNGATTVTYSYDGEGALVGQCVNGACTAILTSGKDVVGDSAGSLYAYGPTGAASVRSAAGVTSYPATDHHGSVLATVSATGVVASRSAYDVYGNTRATAGTPPALGYDGEYTGDQGQTVWLRARAYSPAIGRFLQRDSFVGTSARPSSLNRYSYAENRPANLTDPSGFDPYDDSWLQKASDFSAGIGSAFGTDYINHWLGNDDVIHKCSGFYASGRDTGITALVALLTAAGGGEAAPEALELEAIESGGPPLGSAANPEVLGPLVGHGPRNVTPRDPALPGYVEGAAASGAFVTPAGTTVAPGSVLTGNGSYVVDYSETYLSGNHITVGAVLDSEFTGTLTVAQNIILKGGNVRVVGVMSHPGAGGQVTITQNVTGTGVEAVEAIGCRTCGSLTEPPSSSSSFAEEYHRLQSLEIK